MPHKMIIDDILAEEELILAGDPRLQELRDHINQLITENFAALVNVLYRIDVSETQLKKLLLEKKHEDAAAIIALLIMERHSEKIRSRQVTRSNEDSGEERW